MRDDEDAFSSLAEVVLIGQGEPRHAQAFCEHRSIDVFHCTVTPKNEAHRRYGLERGSVMEVAGPKVWLRGARTFFSPNARQGRTIGDPMQLPGTFVIDTAGVVRYAHRNTTSADNPPNEELLAALQALHRAEPAEG